MRDLGLGGRDVGFEGGLTLVSVDGLDLGRIELGGQAVDLGLVEDLIGAQQRDFLVLAGRLVLDLQLLEEDDLCALLAFADALIVLPDPLESTCPRRLFHAAQFGGLIIGEPMLTGKAGGQQKQDVDATVMLAS